MTNFLFNESQATIINDWLTEVITDDEFIKILLETKEMDRGRTDKISKWMGIGSLVQYCLHNDILGETFDMKGQCSYCYTSNSECTLDELDSTICVDCKAEGRDQRRLR